MLFGYLPIGVLISSLIFMNCWYLRVLSFIFPAYNFLLLFYNFEALFSNTWTSYVPTQISLSLCTGLYYFCGWHSLFLLVKHPFLLLQAMMFCLVENSFYAFSGDDFSTPSTRGDRHRIQAGQSHNFISQSSVIGLERPCDQSWTNQCLP